VHVGVVGQITPDKGVDDVVRWFADAPADMVLHVRGAGVADDGGFAHELVKTARRTLGDRFANDGLVERGAAVAGLDVLVVANPDEPFGRTVIEAQLAGVVPLVPDTGGSSELVDPERTGLRYAAGDGASFAAALANLDLDRAMLRQISASAPQGARETADPERIRAAYTAVLKGGAR
jgi:glycosyltransferase involved in cell wall biosynthesis